MLQQPAQAPVALHLALEIGVGRVGQLEIAHRSKQFGRFLGKSRRFALQAGDQLPLIDHVAVAAQRRSHPGILRHAETFVRQRRSGHPHLALGLGAVQAGDVLFGEQAAPGRVGDDHQFGDQLVERAAALAFGDLDDAMVRIGQIADDGEVVVVDALHGRGFAAPAFAGVGKVPEVEQFVLERLIGQGAVDGFAVEPRLDFVMAQIGGDMHHFQPRFVAEDFQRFADRQVQGHGRAIDAAGQRVVLDHGVGQHGDLVAGHVDRGQPGAGDAVERRAVGDGQPGRRDVDADARTNAGQPDDRQRVVDFCGLGVVDREGADVGARQVARQLGRVERREAGAFRELLVQESTVMQEIGRLDGTALEQQLRRRQAGFAAGRLEGFGFRLVAVRRVEQGVGQRADFRRQAEFLQLVDPAFDRQRLLTLFFKIGQSSCENVGRRLAEAALAFAVEIDGRGVQGKQHRRRFARRGVVSVVVTGKIKKRKFAIVHALPQEIRFDLVGQRRRLFEQRRSGRFLETQQYRRGLDLAALAGGHFDLQRAVVVGHDAAGLEAAIFFKQYVHRRIITQRIQ